MKNGIGKTLVTCEFSIDELELLKTICEEYEEEDDQNDSIELEFITAKRKIDSYCGKGNGIYSK